MDSGEDKSFHKKSATLDSILYSKHGADDDRKEHIYINIDEVRML